MDFSYFDFLAKAFGTGFRILITLSVLAGLTVGVGLGALIYHLVV